MKLTKITAPVTKEKKKRGRPKGSTKIKSPWFTFICPRCGAKYGAMMENAEFSCYNKETKCNGTIAKLKKGK